MCETNVNQDITCNVVNSNHVSHFVNSLSEFYVSEQYLDVEFECKHNVSVKTNKLLLISVSDFLKEMLCSVCECETVYISVPDVESDAVEILISFLREGITKVNLNQLVCLKELLILFHIKLENTEVSPETATSDDTCQLTENVWKIEKDSSFEKIFVDECRSDSYSGNEDTEEYLPNKKKSKLALSEDIHEKYTSKKKPSFVDQVEQSIKIISAASENAIGRHFLCDDITESSVEQEEDNNKEKDGAVSEKNKSNPFLDERMSEECVSEKDSLFIEDFSQLVRHISHETGNSTEEYLLPDDVMKSAVKHEAEDNEEQPAMVKQEEMFSEHVNENFDSMGDDNNFLSIDVDSHIKKEQSGSDNEVIVLDNSDDDDDDSSETMMIKQETSASDNLTGLSSTSRLYSNLSSYIKPELSGSSSKPNNVLREHCVKFSEYLEIILGRKLTSTEKITLKNAFIQDCPVDIFAKRLGIPYESVLHWLQLRRKQCFPNDVIGVPSVTSDSDIGDELSSQSRHQETGMSSDSSETFYNLKSSSKYVKILPSTSEEPESSYSPSGKCYKLREHCKKFSEYLEKIFDRSLTHLERAALHCAFFQNWSAREFSDSLGILYEHVYLWFQIKRKNCAKHGPNSCIESPGPLTLIPSSTMKYQRILPKGSEQQIASKGSEQTTLPKDSDQNNSSQISDNATSGFTLLTVPQAPLPQSAPAPPPQPSVIVPPVVVCPMPSNVATNELLYNPSGTLNDVLGIASISKDTEFPTTVGVQTEPKTSNNPTFYNLESSAKDYNVLSSAVEEPKMDSDVSVPTGYAETVPSSNPTQTYFLTPNTQSPSNSAATCYSLGEHCAKFSEYLEKMYDKKLAHREKEILQKAFTKNWSPQYFAKKFGVFYKHVHYWFQFQRKECQKHPFYTCMEFPREGSAKLPRTLSKYQRILPKDSGQNNSSPSPAPDNKSKNKNSENTLWNFPQSHQRPHRFLPTPPPPPQPPPPPPPLSLQQPVIVPPMAMCPVPTNFYPTANESLNFPSGLTLLAAPQPQPIMMIPPIVFAMPQTDNKSMQSTIYPGPASIANPGSFCYTLGGNTQDLMANKVPASTGTYFITDSPKHIIADSATITTSPNISAVQEQTNR